MRLFSEHKIATAALGAYYLWWVFFFYVMSIPGCNLGIPLMLLLAMLVSGTYLVVVMVKLFMSRDQSRADYFLFLWLVSVPVFLVLLYFMAFA